PLVPADDWEEISRLRTTVALMEKKLNQQIDYEVSLLQKFAELSDKIAILTEENHQLSAQLTTKVRAQSQPQLHGPSAISGSDADANACASGSGDIDSASSNIDSASGNIDSASGDIDSASGNGDSASKESWQIVKRKEAANKPSNRKCRNKHGKKNHRTATSVEATADSESSGNNDKTADNASQHCTTRKSKGNRKRGKKNHGTASGSGCLPLTNRFLCLLTSN
ncbi:hypothetical protein H4R20_005821, partial [Coemansia guatemalensis]